MATYSWRIVQSKRYEYEIPTPAAFAEVGKAYSGICQAFESANGRKVSYDDDIQAECGDDCIRLFFVVNTSGKTTKDEMTLG